MRNSIDLIFSWIVTIIVIVINIITYILFRKQEQYHIAEGEMKNQLKEYEYQKLHYEQVEQHQQEIRKIRHDMKNQIAGIYGYLEKGEIEEGKREVCSILNQLEKAEQKLFTANAVVNGILNMKYVEIEAKQIEAKLDVKLPEILGITGTDLGVLFGIYWIMQSKHASLAKKKKADAAFVSLVSYLIWLAANSRWLSVAGLMAEGDTASALYGTGQTICLGYHVTDMAYSWHDPGRNRSLSPQPLY